MNDVRVTTVTVRDELHEERTVALSHPFASILNGMPGSDDVHTIDLHRENMSPKYDTCER